MTYNQYKTKLLSISAKSLFKIAVLLVSFLLSSTGYSADFIIQLVPQTNSVGDSQVSTISANKIQGLGALSTKSQIQESDIDGLININKILGIGSFAGKSSLVETDIPLLSVSKVSNLQTILDAKADGSLLGSLAMKSSLGVNDIPTLTLSKISDAGSLASKSLLIESDIPSLSISKIIDLQSALDTISNSLSFLSTQVTNLSTIINNKLDNTSLIPDSNIISISGSKVVGPVQVGVDNSNSCTSEGLTRFNSTLKILEVCNGSSWTYLAEYSNTSIHVSAKTQSGQSLSYGYNLIVFNEIEKDTGSNVSLANGWRFTASEPGYYAVAGNAFLAVAKTELELTIFKNGVAYRDSFKMASDRSIGIASTVYLAAGEYIDLRVYVSSAGSLSPNNILNWVTIDKLH